MHPSAKIYIFIKIFESLHDGDLRKIGLQPKPDPVGYWTEGWGHLMLRNGKKLHMKQYPTIASVLTYSAISTVADADRQLEIDLQATVRGVNNRLRVEVSQHQFDALVSHAFNCGFSSTLYSLVNDKAHISKIKHWFTTKYITANGVYLKGLQYRRNDEFEIFIGKNYDREYNLSI
jgi:lysozyme